MAGPASKTGQGLFSIPLIPRSEIPKILSEYQIMNISESDIVNPNPNFIFNLFSSLLIHLDTQQDDPSQVDFAALDRFDNPDMHVDAIRVMNLFVKIKEVLLTLECPLDFSLNDLIRPESGRTIKFLSAFLNFFFHRDSKLNLLSSYWEEVDALDAQRGEKENRISQLKEEIAALNDAREREKPLVLEAEAKVKELRQTIDKLNTLQSQLRKDRQLMKDKAQEMQANVSKAEFELIQATEEHARLRSKIVQSPDKLQKALEDKKAVLAEAKNLERLAMQSFEEKTSMLEVYTKASEKLTKQLTQMQAIKEQMNSAKAVEKDVKLMKTKLSDEQMLDKSMEAKIVEHQSKLEQLDEHKRHLEKEANVRREGDTKALNNVKMEAESRKHILKAKESKIEAVLVEVDEVKAKIDLTKAQEAATLLQLHKKAEEVVNELIQYQSSMDQLMDSAKIYVDPSLL